MAGSNCLYINNNILNPIYLPIVGITVISPKKDCCGKRGNLEEDICHVALANNYQAWQAIF